jgi:hypothetical protein
MNLDAITNEIFNRLINQLPVFWDGKESVLYMRDHGCHNWRQMEWPGWYFQFMCEQILGQDGFFSIPGPAYGNVEFDGKHIIPWDFKAHSANLSDKVPTNGYQEVRMALDDYGLVGFIVARGAVDFDDEFQSFKRWHDELKGETSPYELERIERGALPRRKKSPSGFFRLTLFL